MPYVGRLPAIHMGQPVLIVGFDATSVLVVNREGRLQYLDHNAVEIPLHGDAEAVFWMESGYAFESDPDPVDDGTTGPYLGDDEGDTR